MDFLVGKVRELRGLFARKQSAEEKREVTKCDAYCELAYKVLSWEDATLTLTVFLVLNFLFWLVIQLELRLFGVIFLLALAGYVADFCLDATQAVVVETQHLEAFDELRNDIVDVVLSLKALRKDSPSSFCIGMSFMFLALSFIAKNLSGPVIAYFTLISFFIVPLIVQLLPPELIAKLKRFVRAISSDRGVLAEHELMPFLSSKNFQGGDPDLDSLLSDRTADSLTNSLISGLNSMPSHLDGDDRASLDEDDLLPGGPSPVSFTPGDLSSDSDSDHKGIRFDSAHFNGDSSSDDDIYPKDYSIPSVTQLDSGSKEFIAEEVSTLVNVASASKNFLAHMISPVVTNRPAERKNSSSDSEFEIINSEEAAEQ